MRGLLIAFEGLDQSGKQTQAERLRDVLVAQQRLVRLLSFPAYETAIGEEIGRALRGLREYSSEVMQLLYVANRYEHKTLIDTERERGTILVCDRYLASSVAYGEAQGLDAGWLIDMLIALDRQLAHVAANLSYFFSPNTHLTGEALALYVVGTALPELAQIVVLAQRAPR